MSAARRAATRYAAASNVQLLRIPPELVGSSHRPILILARADADLGDSDRLFAVATGEPSASVIQGDVARGVAQRAEALATTLTRAGTTARRLRTSQLEPEYAAVLADEIAGVLPDLMSLEHRLRIRAAGPAGVNLPV